MIKRIYKNLNNNEYTDKEIVFNCLYTYMKENNMLTKLINYLGNNSNGDSNIDFDNDEYIYILENYYTDKADMNKVMIKVIKDIDNNK